MRAWFGTALFKTNVRWHKFFITRKSKRGAHQKQHKEDPEKISPEQRDYETKRLRLITLNLLRKSVWNELKLILPTPALNMIYVQFRSLSPMTTTDIKLLVLHQQYSDLSEYLPRNTYIHSPGVPRNVSRNWYGATTFFPLFVCGNWIATYEVAHH